MELTTGNVEGMDSIQFCIHGGMTIEEQQPEEWFLQELEVIQRRINRENATFQDDIDWREFGF